MRILVGFTPDAAPAGTPPAIVERLNRETNRILAMPDVKKKLNDIGAEVIGGTPAEFAAAIERGIPQWARVIRQASRLASSA